MTGGGAGEIRFREIVGCLHGDEETLVSAIAVDFERLLGCLLAAGCLICRLHGLYTMHLRYMVYYDRYGQNHRSEYGHCF